MEFVELACPLESEDLGRDRLLWYKLFSILIVRITYRAECRLAVLLESGRGHDVMLCVVI